MFSLAHLWRDTGVENSDIKDVLQITCSHPEATREPFTKEQPVVSEMTKGVLLKFQHQKTVLGTPP